jgi:hypothetical protein
LLDSANAITPAMTMARRVSMLELLSTTETYGHRCILAAEHRDGLGVPSSTT